jgi:type IV pilus assembly protein PilA
MKSSQGPGDVEDSSLWLLSVHPRRVNMLEKFRERRNEESGFTLVELLVVMLILGILAAIAIPAFFSQRDKGYDSDAKANARTVQTALESYSTDNGGAYTGADMAALANIEGTINNMTDVSIAVTADTYTITSASDSGNSFEISRAASGQLGYACTTDGNAGCPPGGDWG